MDIAIDLTDSPRDLAPSSSPSPPPSSSSDDDDDVVAARLRVLITSDAALYACVLTYEPIEVAQLMQLAYAHGIAVEVPGHVHTPVSSYAVHTPP